MNTVIPTISENLRELLRFLKGTSFSKAVLIAIAVTVPILLGIKLGHVEIGLALSFGALWSSPSDVSGSYRHKKFGILYSAALVVVVSFIGGFLRFGTWSVLPILGIVTFAIAYISVFGFRASLISFSGLLALVLSFAHKLEELEVYQYALLIGVGGLWYLLLAILWQQLNPKGQTEETLSEAYLITATFLETRGKLVDPQTDRKKLRSELHMLQHKLIEIHETLRDILISSRKSSGRSVYESKRLLVFAELVEMLETAIANPGNYDKMDVIFKAHPEYIKSFQNLIFEMSRQLCMIAEAGNDEKKLPKNNKLVECFAQVGLHIASLKAERKNKDYQDFLMFQNLLEYQEKQFEKIKRIKWLLGNPNREDIDFIDRKVAREFLAPQDYDPKLLISNLSFTSNMFKHALRLAVTVMIGYALGSLFAFQNPYWILLTIIVIMRPSYGLTKTRAKDRIIGTLLGGTIASGVVFMVHNPYVYGAMGVVSLVIAFSMVQKNYKTSSTFITLSVVFIYAILRPDILTVIQYRILDTLIGAALSFVALLWLWPAWGFQEIRESIAKSVKANADFLAQIANYYQKKGIVPTSLKVSRKEAFVETSNLSSAFQRMAQEPKSKQKNLNKIYELEVLNHAFLSSLASLSTYIQQNPTTKASEQFKRATNQIDKNLMEVLWSLQESKSLEVSPDFEKEHLFNERLSALEQENITHASTMDPLLERNFKEAHLVREQLQWLFSISGKMLSLTSQIKFE